MESSSDAAVPATGPALLVARDRELAVLDALIGRVGAGAGAAVLVQGPAGIGKTALLAVAARMAAESGMKVLRALGDGLEQEYAFGVVREWFIPVVGQRGGAASLFEGAAGLAAVPLGLLAPTADSPGAWGDPSSAAMHGLYWLTVSLAGAAPLMLILDDAHWADATSLRFLLYLTRRLEDLPVLVLLATRPDPEPPATRDLLTQIAGQTGLEALCLQPLAEPDVARVIQHVALVDPDEAFVDACQHASGGNPFLLVELLRAARAEGVQGRGADAATVMRIAPQSVVRWVSARLSELGEDAERLASAVAVLGSGATLSEAAALADVTRSPEHVADVLIRAHLLTGGPRLEFAHPLIESAVGDRLAPASRAAAHARAARLTAAHGAPLPRVAGHLLAVGPGSDAWAVQTLRDAAREASASGAPGSAAAYLERALAETVPRLVRADLLVELGEAQLHAGVSGATERMREALGLQEDPLARAEICLGLGRALFARGEFQAARDSFARGLEDLPDGRDDLLLELRAWYVTDAHNDLPLPDVAAAWLHELLEGDAPGANRTERHLLAQVTYQSARSGERRAEDVARLARRALADGELLKESGREIGPYLAVCHALVAAGRPDAAVGELTRARALSQRQGSSVAFGWLSHLRGIALYSCGRLVDAMADLESAGEAATRAGAQPMADTRALLAVCRLERDEPDGAAAALAVTAEPESPSFPSCSYAYAVGRLRAGHGHPREGLQALMACQRWIVEMRAPNPAANLPWRADAAMLAATLGDTDGAGRLIAENLELARAFGAPHGVGIALRAAGLIERGRRGLELLDEAVTLLDGSGFDLQLARALIDQGAAIRRTGRRRDALDPLRRGLDLASGCGGLALARRAREELIAAGARPRRARISGADALTASELRVARMAARGMSNPEIAQALFITRKTVTAHLSHIYQKLNIEARTQLARALGQP